MRLLQVSAFYKNDKPNGIGITLQFDGLDEAMAILRSSYTQMWEESVRQGDVAETQLVIDLKRQLDELGQRRGKLSEPEILLALGNIWLLQEMGAIPDDDFNGLLCAYGD